MVERGRVDNPLDKLGLSPLATVDEITAALRERAEDASEEERKVLRATWEELTLHPRSRVRAAVLTFPPRKSSGEARAPGLSPALRPAPAAGDDHSRGVAPVDLLPRPAVARALGANGRIPPAPAALPPLDDDPLISRALIARTDRSGS
jgi:hypothetical protein